MFLLFSSREFFHKHDRHKLCDLNKMNYLPNEMQRVIPAYVCLINARPEFLIFSCYSEVMMFMVIISYSYEDVNMLSCLLSCGCITKVFTAMITNSKYK